jgi:hypothetical protein
MMGVKQTAGRHNCVQGEPAANYSGLSLRLISSVTDNGTCFSLSPSFLTTIINHHHHC